MKDLMKDRKFRNGERRGKRKEKYKDGKRSFIIFWIGNVYLKAIRECKLH